jgi:anti-sigma factor RsiW
MASQLSEREMAELSALADGTLPADRRAEVEARVAASPELQELLERQRQALVAMQAIAADEPPASLSATIERQRRTRRSGRHIWLEWRVALPALAAVAAVVVAALLLTGGPGAPSVADAAALGTRPPTEPAPGPAGTSATRLAIGVQGVAFPDFARAYGWTALGVRHGHIDGRAATVVYYGKGERRLAYVIVSGQGLIPPPNGDVSTVRGVEYRILRFDGHLAVTWRRGGHTCVLLGQAGAPELVKLASWPL